MNAATVAAGLLRSLIPSLGAEEFFPTLVTLEHFLVPGLKPGQVVVMDNLGAHKPKRVRELIEDRGCQLLYLPAYSPGYNPIEESL